jgi:uncharacterized protein YdhG (YjbR/CyaY superfamily)
MSMIDELIDQFSAPQKVEMERIRKIVKKIVPGAEEVISYGIPAFKYQNKYLIGYCAYKKHLSIFPTSGPIDALRNKLVAYKLSRGTIQFTLENPIPETIIREIVQIRLDAISNS